MSDENKDKQQAPQNNVEGNSATNVDFPTIDTMNVSSATDLTGLMYHPPLNEDELESYQDLYELEYSEADEGV